jgi:tryptophanyl-tRNA synthetase
MAHVFSGIQPSGDLHLGNYLGALRRFADEQYKHDSLFCVVDLHALTVPQDPVELAAKTRELAAIYLAVGLEPDVCTMFVQSHVHEHTELAWILECTVSFGELRRMTQFKEKSESAEFVSAGLFTYPALMAADVLLYDVDKVPVGDDQRQHVEIMRDIAIRFNGRYGETFVVPEAEIPEVAARVMDLQEPRAKMSKSADSPQGTVRILDEPEVIERKIRRAVTDTGTDVVYDREVRPGVANLLDILAACTGEPPDRLAAKYTQYGPLKADVAATVVELLRPVQARYREIASDPVELERTLEKGAAKAQARAAVTLDRARAALGLVPRDSRQ